MGVKEELARLKALKKEKMQEEKDKKELEKLQAELEPTPFQKAKKFLDKL